MTFTVNNADEMTVATSGKINVVMINGVYINDNNVNKCTIF